MPSRLDEQQKQAPHNQKGLALRGLPIHRKLSCSSLPPVAKLSALGNPITLAVVVFPPSQLVVVARQLYQVRLELPYFLLGEAALDVLHRTQHLPSDVSVGPLERGPPHGRRAACIDGEGGPPSFRVLDYVPSVEEGRAVREIDAPSRGEGYPGGESQVARKMSR